MSTTENSIKKIKRCCGYALLASFILSFTGCNNDDDDMPEDVVSEQDQNFAVNATYSNLAEIEMGELALSKSSDAEIQDYAETMVTAHTTAQNELSAIASSREISIPDTLNNEKQGIHQQLSALEGAAFDSAYIYTQVVAHQEAQQIFQTQIDQGQNSQLVNYASSTLPDINQHFESATELRDEKFPTVGD